VGGSLQNASKTTVRDCPHLGSFSPPHGIAHLEMGNPVLKMGNPVRKMDNPVRSPLVSESLDSTFENQLGNPVQSQNT
jgi:hypothetical protein